MDEDNRHCQICTLEKAKYVCPRCGVPYCSLKCYKDESKHLQCSESFYKECVMNDLKAQETSNPEGAKKMAEALQRFRQQYDEDGDEEGEIDGDEEEVLDSDDDDPLEKRLEGINLDDSDTVWLSLTEEERRDFRKFVKDVDVNDIVPEWVPWWTIKPDGKKMVEEVTEQSGTKVGVKSCKKLHKQQPDILESIPTMKSLTKVRPNDHVKRGLGNVIGAYVWTARLYNGDFLSYDNPEEIAHSLIELSSFLGEDTVFTTFDQALADVSFNAVQCPDLFDGGPSLPLTLNRDVFTIMSGPEPSSGVSESAESEFLRKKAYVLAALTECYKILTKTVKLKNLKLKSKPTASSIKSSKPLENPSDPSWVEELPPDSESTSASKTVRNITCDSDDDDHGDEDSFHKTFMNPSSRNLYYVDPKLLSKARRKVHYLIAFANEYNVMM